MSNNNSNIPKFYKPTQMQQRQIMFMNLRNRMDQNQSHIIQILNKYRQVVPDQPMQSKNSKQKSTGKLKQKKKIPNTRQIRQHAKKSLYGAQNVYKSIQHNKNNIKLPKVGNEAKQSIMSKHKSKSFMDHKQKIPYSTLIKKDTRQKNRINKSVFEKYKTIDLQNTYKQNPKLTDRQKFLNEENDFQKYFLKQMVLKLDKDIEQEIKNSNIDYTQNLGLTKPLQYRRPQRKNEKSQQSQSSNEETQVPITFYEKQLRQTLQKQTLDQLNFLYFSKNQSMKDWTEGLLSMFEKHNKQTDHLKHKCKYLQMFDQSFFTADIYRQK